MLIFVGEDLRDEEWDLIFVFVLDFQYVSLVLSFDILLVQCDSFWRNLWFLTVRVMWGIT